ncbi:MAG: nucleotidyl transferase AbiEii/AbiGii toxin family protein [Gammaproteobacteria bacterium]
MAERVPEAFLKVLAALAAWLEQTHIPAMVVGGVAASILGRPRATRDIDTLAMLPEHRWAAALAGAREHGILARIEQPLEFARRTRVLLLRHAESGIDMDVILGRLPFEEQAIARSKLHNLGGVQVRLPQVEDLLIMKAIAQRPQDLRDIEGLLDVHPHANLDHVRQWIREFATAMTMPDVLEGFERLLAQRKASSGP